MKSFFKFTEKNSKKPGKLAVVFLLVLMSFSFLVIQPKPAQAQIISSDILAEALLAAQNAILTGGQAAETAAITTGAAVQSTAVKTTSFLNKLWVKGGSVALQQTLRTVLNKVAMDTANYVGSGGQGQKPLFITNPLSYVSDLGDEAAGAYLENFANNLSASSACDQKKQACINSCIQPLLADCHCDGLCVSPTDQKSACQHSCDTAYNNALADNSSETGTNDALKARDACGKGCDSMVTGPASTGTTIANGLATPSFNVCSPSSIDAQLKITLGLAQQSRSSGPDCTASNIIKNWTNLDNYGNSVKALKDLYDSTKGGYNDQLFLSDIKGIFQPGGNDLSVYLTAKTDSAKLADNAKVAGTNTLVGKGGWLDATNIAGTSIGLPNQAQLTTEESYKQYSDNIGKYTGEAFTDALNTFLSQTAYTAFNTLMQNLGKTATQGTASNSANYGDPNSNPDLGESSLSAATSKLNKPDYGSQTNYDILSQLSMCQDSQRPGPTDCVIDTKLMQAITEHKTVIEAIKDGSLTGTWPLTSDAKFDYQDAYTLRNISILRKYMILPVGWEEAINSANDPKNNVKTVTLNDLVSCFDNSVSYKNFSPNFKHNSDADLAWCRGLVDPNWVLKAPLNSCSKVGIGGQILSDSVNPGIKGTNGQPDTLSTYTVNRADNYCADSQTCIQENSNGTCGAYGYCTEAKRTWNFGTDSCNPINNTCQTFTGGATSKTVSYLKNTLNYSGCDISSAGCREYDLNGKYNTGGNVQWDQSSSRYFNSNSAFSTCDSSEEGCTSLIRVKSPQGTNLVIDSDFSADTVGQAPSGALGACVVKSTAIISDASTDSGINNSRSLKLTGTDGAGLVSDSNNANSLFPTNLQIISGQAYTLSADVYLASGDSVTASIGFDSSNFISTKVTTANQWTHLTVTRSPLDSFNRPVFSINASGAAVVVYIKNIKFEAANVATSYSDYGASKIYEKLLPNYLEAACYTSVGSDYRFKANLTPELQAACSKFARKCNQDEVGCELYTSAGSTFSVAAKVSSSDLCPQECLGYDSYVARAGTFNSAKKENLIPTTAKKCDIEEAGCSEFTNLDSLANGGEQKEYYSELKQCVKPSTTECSAYYSWEGTENGYQLKSYSLKKGVLADGTLADGGPDVTSYSSDDCNSNIYHSDINSPLHNSDCEEFYNAAGQISYRLVSKTITCSDDCHPYRLTEKNIDTTITQASDCTGADKNWDGVACQFCVNGGLWDSNQGACVYQAIPSEGKTCQASSDGCREYNGNKGENVRLINASDFETANSSWSSNCSDGLSLNSVASVDNGHSLKYNNGASINCQAIGEIAQTTIQSDGSSRAPLIRQILATDNVAAQLSVGHSVQQGYAYNINFLARAANNTLVKIYFYNKETGQKSFFNIGAGVTVQGGNAWQVYRANLENLDHVVSDNEVLVITADADFYLDNFVLNEITDRYYLIQGSSQVPDSCYYSNFLDVNGKPTLEGVDYNLGCSQYTDRYGTAHNLRQFNQLCSESGVGCEQMIDTKNYSPGGAGSWTVGTSKETTVNIPTDTAFYAVYDLDKQCNTADAGCSRMGLRSPGLSSTLTDVYKLNNPDNYNSTLCGAGAVGCEKWSSDNGDAYFKDPGDNTCVYRTATSGGSDKSWYQSPVKHCEVNNAFTTTNCVTDADCLTAGGTCVLDNTDYACDLAGTRTFGLGGTGNQITTPAQVGLCDSKESSCTEYIDPISSYTSNLVVNPDFQAIGGITDGWSGGSQTITLDANKLYIFDVEYDAGYSAGSATLTFPTGIQVQVLSNLNVLGGATSNLTVNSAANSLMFYTPNSNTPITATLNGPDQHKTIIVKPAIVDYQLKTNIDANNTKVCNGQVNTDQGCVLFNEREAVSINNQNAFSALPFSATSTSIGTPPPNCQPNVAGSCNANTLIKVQPDRVCSKWLSCVTSVLEPGATAPTCYAVGECDRLSDDNKQCANFVSTGSNQTRIFDVNKDKNASGYSLLGNYYFGQMKEVGSNSDFHYDFEDLVPTLSCALASGGACSFPSNKSMAKELLVKEKVDTTTGNPAPTDYPAHGTTYLKVPSGYLISPQVAGSGTNLAANTTYYLNFLVNTKKSGVAGMVYIKSKNIKDTSSNFTLLSNTNNGTNGPITANSGWERKIISFKTGSDSNLVYRVELGTDGTDQSGAVYFDDLNIEPVLNTGDGQYIARECRLYPETSSLTCSDSLAKDGLEGYCLEHDLKNPSVCSLWYPVDHINSAQTGKALEGYRGVAPLSYCTQVNGNFSLVEKRVAYHIPFVSTNNIGKSCPDVEYGDINGFLSDSSRCESDYVLFSYHHGNDNGKACYYDYWCVPKAIGGTVTVMSSDTAATNIEVDSQNEQTTTPPILAVKGVFHQTGDSSDSSGIISSSDGWYPYNGLSNSESKNADPAVRVYDYNNPPVDESGLKLISGSDQSKNFRFTCDSFSQVVSDNGSNMAWSNRISSASIYPASTPLFFLGYGGNLQLVEKRVGFKILDKPGGTSGPESCEQTTQKCQTGLTDGVIFNDNNYVEWISHHGDGSAHYTKIFCVPDQSKILIPTNTVTLGDDGYDAGNCKGKTFSEGWGLYDGFSSFATACLSSQGCTSLDESKNFATSSLLANQTPLLYDNTYAAREDSLKSLSDSNAYALSRYGRNRENIPFGAATLPSDTDLLSSETVKLRNQYSAQENESIFAGRPYGCQGDGCSNIGSCSLNPDVYCLVDYLHTSFSGFNLNQETCGAGGYGICMPLWYKSLNGTSDPKPDYLNILKTLFLKQYSSYSYNYNTQSYSADSANPYDFSRLGINPIAKCKPSTRPDDNVSFCAIYPNVTNVKLKLGNTEIPLDSNAYKITQRGIYELDFNSIIDAEQQPLKEISIDWGDNTNQVITGQDAKPSINTPHVFYHYYNQAGPLVNVIIKIKITDNWGFYQGYSS